MKGRSHRRCRKTISDKSTSKNSDAKLQNCLKTTSHAVPSRSRESNIFSGTSLQSCRIFADDILEQCPNAIETNSRPLPRCGERFMALFRAGTPIKSSRTLYASFPKRSLPVRFETSLARCASKADFSRESLIS